jgi:hypothetical protein
MQLVLMYTVADEAVLWHTSVSFLFRNAVIILTINQNIPDDIPRMCYTLQDTLHPQS